MSYFLISSPESAYKYNKDVIEKINLILKPLVDNFGIHLVTYRRFFNNGDLLHLSFDESWMNHCVKYHHWTSNSTVNRIIETPIEEKRTYVWTQHPNSNDSVYGALYSFGFYNGATIYERNENSVEVWAFSAGKNNSKAELFYTKDFYILKRFMLYFQDKAKEILDTTDRSKLIPGNPELLLQKSKETSLALEKFIQETSIDKYFLKSTKGDFSISKREAECLFHLSQGKGLKEISSILSLSPRTVESYLNNVKFKTGCSSKSVLLKNYHSAINQWIF